MRGTLFKMITSNDRFSVNYRFSVRIVQKPDHFRGKLLVLFTGFEVMTDLEDKKGLTVFSAKLVVDCITVCFEFVSPTLMFGNTSVDC